MAVSGLLDPRSSERSGAEGEPGRVCHMTRVMKRHPYIRYRRERFVSMSSTFCIVGIGLRSETKNLC